MNLSSLRFQTFENEFKKSQNLSECPTLMVKPLFIWIILKSLTSLSKSLNSIEKVFKKPRNL
jgi:hypothetical protein